MNKQLLGGVALVALCAAGGAPSAMAQTTAAAEEAYVSEIVVTGTNLRGVAPIGSSLLTVGQEEITSSGAVTLNDVLRRQPLVSNLGVTDNNRLGSSGGANISYSNSVNLRGLGPTATLTLLNGHRMAATGTVGTAPDPGVIPAIMLERIDVVADGASATYGSDAIAGVVNLILRRSSSDTAQFTAYSAWGDHYNEQQFGGLLGKTWSGGQVTLGVQWARNSRLSGLHRDYFKSDLTAEGGADYRVTSCSPGTLTVGTTNYAIPAGGVTQATAGQLTPGTVNRCDIWKSLDLRPEQENKGLAFTFDQNVGNVRLYAHGYYSRRDYERENSPPITNLTIASTNPLFIQPPGQTATTERVAWWFGGQGLGDSYPAWGWSENHTATVGVEIPLPFDWRLDARAVNGRNTDLAKEVRYNAPAAQAAVNSGALNPFRPASAATLTPLLNSVFDAKGYSRYRFYDFKVDGDLFTLPAGEIKAAIGYEHHIYKAGNGVLAGNLGAVNWLGGIPPRLYSRTVDSIWGEVAVPIFSDANGAPGMQSLDLTFGIRTSKYSDVGRTTNPKIGLNWRPSDDLLLRASWGKSFRAPLLSDVFRPVPGGSATLTLFALPGGGSGNGYIYSSDALDLTPESAKTWSLGGEWNPSFAPNFRASLNYFNVELKGQVTTVTSSNILLNQSLYPQVITVCPSTACTELYNRHITGTGPNPQPYAVTGGIIANPVALVRATPFNAGITTTDGLDFTLAYTDVETGAGTIGAQVSGTYYFSFDSAVSATAPVVKRIDTIGYPLRFRVRGSLMWESGPWSSDLNVNYTGGYDNNVVVPTEAVSSWATLDFFLRYAFSSDLALLDETRIGLSVKNLLNSDPPFVNIAPQRFGGGGYDPGAASELGRVVGITLSKAF